MRVELSYRDFEALAPENSQNHTELLFDLMSAQPIGRSRFHGGGEYIKTVFEHLALKLPRRCTLTVCLDPDRELEPWIDELLERCDARTCSVSRYEDFYGLINSGRYDLFYSGMPYWLDYRKVNTRTKIIGTIHGLRSVECVSDRYAGINGSLTERVKWLIKLRFASSFRRRAIKDYARCSRALDVVVAVSEHSTYSIRTHLYRENISEIHTLYSPKKHAVVPVHPKNIDISKKFILLICCNRWEKNSFRAIKALNDMFDRGLLEGYSVVCCGLEVSARKRVFKRLLKNRFIMMGYVDAEELEWLYMHCSVFLYPSLNEGFGYPPLEAMKYGTTCIVSGITSIPEVCGDAAYYINPYDINEMQTRLVEAIDNPKEPQSVIERANMICKRQDEDLDRLVELITDLEDSQVSASFRDS